MISKCSLPPAPLASQAHTPCDLSQRPSLTSGGTIVMRFASLSFPRQRISPRQREDPSRRNFGETYVAPPFHNYPGSHLSCKFIRFPRELLRLPHVSLVVPQSTRANKERGFVALLCHGLYRGIHAWRWSQQPFFACPDLPISANGELGSAFRDLEQQVGSETRYHRPRFLAPR